MNELETLIQNGVKNLEDGNFEDALSFFEQALLLKPDDPDLWNNKGIASVSYTHLTLPTKA